MIPRMHIPYPVTAACIPASTVSVLFRVDVERFRLPQAASSPASNFSFPHESAYSSLIGVTVRVSSTADFLASFASKTSSRGDACY